MATLSAVGGSRIVTLTGSGHPANAKVVVTVAFSATGRRFNEMRMVDTDGSGVISTVLFVPFAGSVTARAIDPVVGTVQATTGSATVT
jgi:hypothetical protein